MMPGAIALRSPITLSSRRNAPGEKSVRSTPGCVGGETSESHREPGAGRPVAHTLDFFADFLLKTGAHNERVAHDKGEPAPPDPALGVILVVHVERPAGAAYIAGSDRDAGAAAPVVGVPLVDGTRGLDAIDPRAARRRVDGQIADRVHVG